MQKVDIKISDRVIFLGQHLILYANPSVGYPFKTERTEVTLNEVFYLRIHFCSSIQRATRNRNYDATIVSTTH